MKNMKNMFMVFTYLLSVIPKGVGHGGMKTLIAENLMLKLSCSFSPDPENEPCPFYTFIPIKIFGFSRYCKAG